MLESNVIQVRRKGKGFTQIYNQPIQEDLPDLNTIGLLTYLISLPEDWVIRKTHLHKRFSRRTVDNAWKVLVEKNYAIDFSFNVEGKKGKVYIYQVSDEKYTEDEFNEIVENTIKAYNDAGYTVNLDTFETNNFFDVRFVQYKLYSTNCTPTNKYKTNKHKQINNNKLTIVNKERETDFENTSVNENQTESENTSENKKTVSDVYDTEEIKKKVIDICNEYYTEFALSRWNKKQWVTLVKKYADEFTNNNAHYRVSSDNLDSYVYNSLKNMAYSHDRKYGKLLDSKNDFTTENDNLEDSISDIYYDWLNDSEEND